MKYFGLSILAAILLNESATDAFSLKVAPTILKSRSAGLGHLNSHHGDESTAAVSSSSPSRRDVLNSVATSFLSFGVASTATLASFPLEANAYPQEKTDKDNIVKGYKRLKYLLDNWEKETTVCGRTDNPYIGCERTPEKVMVYLGFKSMNDPLFRADKTMMRLQALVPGDSDIDYMEAMESFNEKSEEASNTAFISSWGEANPGGGKDRVDMFIERSRKQIEVAKNSLGTVIQILDLKVD